jgi:hypothetical protein
LPTEKEKQFILMFMRLFNEECQDDTEYELVRMWAFTWRG